MSAVASNIRSGSWDRYRTQGTRIGLELGAPLLPFLFGSLGLLLLLVEYVLDETSSALLSPPSPTVAYANSVGALAARAALPNLPRGSL